MIKVFANTLGEFNKSKVELKYELIRYPDGTKKIDFDAESCVVLQLCQSHNHTILIKWVGYSGDDEMSTLWFITRYIQDAWQLEVSLLMPYIPNARMDRTKNYGEVLTVKYFADFVNALNFKRVIVLDPHSNVSEALIKNCTVLQVLDVIENAITRVKDENQNSMLWIYFPDEGAAKRYGDIVKNKPYFLGHKVRDWKTGKITGLEITRENTDITPEEIEGAGDVVLMIDDIISYGGTLAYSADELKKTWKFSKIYAYATHVENSVLDKEKGTLWKRIEDGVVDKIFTTDSLLTEKNYLINKFAV